MKVRAKCITRAFDNDTSMLFEPGEFYEIEHNGKLASLKTGQRYVKWDGEGKPVGDPMGGKYVFEFDRAVAASTAASPSAGLAAVVPLPVIDYKCKKCGSVFHSLNDLGTHSRSQHPAEPEEFPVEDPEQESEDAVRVDRRGIGPRNCKGCGEPFENLNALTKHKPSCPGTIAEVSAQDQEVAQADPA